MLAFRSKKSKNRRRRKTSRIGRVETLENRRLFAVDWTFNSGILEGKSSVLSFSADSITIDSSSLNVTNNGSAINIPGHGTVLASSVQDIRIKTRGFPDLIDLSAVDQFKFPSLTSTRLDGDGGADIIRGSYIGDEIIGNSGDDTVYGNGGNDDIKGGVGQDHLYGGNGNDTIHGGLNADTIHGGKGHDRLHGNGGRDTICGQEGNDYLYGGTNGDKLYGGSGNDFVRGDTGKDIIEGGPGADRLYARINGELTRDTVYRDSADTTVDVNPQRIKIGWFWVRNPSRDTVHYGTTGNACQEGGGGGGTPHECLVDFGDAPDSYKTTLAANGARHETVGPRLGAFRDHEANGVPSANADSDDIAILYGPKDDEDGISFVGGNRLHTGRTHTVLVNVQNLQPGEVAKLDAWIDTDISSTREFNRGDRIFSSETLHPGINTLLFKVDSTGVALRDTFARFRISYEGGLGPTGYHKNGEVEDYAVEIYCDHGGGVVIDKGNSNDVGVPLSDPIPLGLHSPVGEVPFDGQWDHSEHVSEASVRAGESLDGESLNGDQTDKAFESMELDREIRAHRELEMLESFDQECHQQAADAVFASFA